MKIEENFVRDYYSGNTHILVADDYYRNMTAEDVEMKLREIAEIVQRAMYAASANETE